MISQNPNPDGENARLFDVLNEVNDGCDELVGEDDGMLVTVGCIDDDGWYEGRNEGCLEGLGEG